MKTMGFGRLAIAGRILDFDREKIGFMSVHAQDVFDRSERHDSLESAVADCALSAGVTRRHGKRRKYSSFLPEEFAAQILTIVGTSNSSVAMVFGNEEHGLTNEELAVCNAAVHIPSDDTFPSLNLSHAVQVVTYTLRRCFESAQYRRNDNAFQPLSRAVEQRLFDRLTRSTVAALDAIGFFRISESAPTGTFLRDVFSRAALSGSEIREMERIFRKIRHLKLRDDDESLDDSAESSGGGDR